MTEEFSTPAAANQRDDRCGVLVVPGLGTLELVWNPSGLVRVSFGGGRRAGEGKSEVLSDVPPGFADPLGRYFRGERVDPALLPVDLRGTAFQLRVWTVLRAIPRGRVRTYASVAAEVGSPRGMRAVGMATARNPLAVVVPCHRVVEAGGKLGGYSAGTERKIHLLALEGIKVDRDCVLAGQLDLF